MHNKKGYIVAGLIILLGVGQAHAFDWFGGRLSIGGGYGRSKPKLPYTYQDTYEDGAMWTANMKYFLNQRWSLVGSYADMKASRRGNNQDIYRFTPLVGSLRFNLFDNLPFSPYLTAGAGYAWNKRQAPGIATQKWDGLTWQGGLGLEFFITEGTSLGAEALYHHFSGGNNAEHFSPYRLVSAVGTVNLYFGKGPSHRRTEEALQRQKEEAERAKREAEEAQARAATSQEQANSAQQAALQAQQGQTAAEQAALAASAAAAVQVQQAQAEVEEIKQMVATKQISPITFKSGSAELQSSSNASLDKVAGIAKKYPTLKLQVEGHTDSTGSAELNQTLSQKRADSVRDYLTSHGVPDSQISAVGFGPSRPIASNDSSSGRSQNRRVEFIFNLP